ncbi:MAG: hypothetical protein ABIQ70_04125 [Dokdonella sp.]
MLTLEMRADADDVLVIQGFTNQHAIGVASLVRRRRERAIDGMMADKRIMLTQPIRRETRPRVIGRIGSVK